MTNVNNVIDQNKNSRVTDGFAWVVPTQIVFIMLKGLGITSGSWWWIFFPLWGTAILLAALMLIAVIAIVVSSVLKKL